MSRPDRIWPVLLAWGVMLAGAAFSSPSVVPAEELDRERQERADREYFTDLPLLTQEGREVLFYSDVLRGRVVLISSFYTECQGVSPRQAEVLAGLQEMLGDQMGRDVHFVSITVDPETDTPEVVAEYAREAGAGPGWIFLTGKPENVDWINHRLGHHLEHLDDHQGVYLLGNLRTALWMKAPAHAMALDLYREIQRLIGDDDESGDAVGGDAAAPPSAPPSGGSRAVPSGDDGGAELAPAEERGREIYFTGAPPSGEPITALLGEDGLELPGEAARCAGCHGHDGTGRPEGGVLPSDVTWSHLIRSYGHVHPDGTEHPPFDEGSVARYLTTGVFPGGAPGDPSMPRYRIATDDLADLVAFLKRVGTLPEPGVGEDAIRIGTLVPSEGELRGVGRAIVEVLEGTFEEVNRSGGIYGRELALVVGDGADLRRPAAVRSWLAAEQPFALVSPFLPAAEGDVYEALAEQSLSVVGPVALESIRSFSLSRNVYQLLPGLGEQVEALLRHVAAEPGQERPPAALLLPRSGGASPDLAVAVEEAARRLGWSSLRTARIPAPGARTAEAVRALQDAGVEMVVSLGVEEELRNLLREARERAWRPWVLAPGVLTGTLALDLPREERSRLLLAYPTLPRDRDPKTMTRLLALLDGRQVARSHVPVAVSAHCAATVLIEALRRVGRDVGRREMAAELDGLYRFETGLMPPVTFTANTRVGVRGAYVVPGDAVGGGRIDGFGVWVDLDRAENTPRGEEEARSPRPGTASNESSISHRPWRAEGFARKAKP